MNRTAGPPLVMQEVRFIFQRNILTMWLCRSLKRVASEGNKNKDKRTVGLPAFYCPNESLVTPFHLKATATRTFSGLSASLCSSILGFFLGRTITALARKLPLPFPLFESSGVTSLFSAISERCPVLHRRREDIKSENSMFTPRRRLKEVIS